MPMRNIIPLIFPECTSRFVAKFSSQIEVVNGLQLLTAKPVTYLVNLSEKDYIRKKNKWYVHDQPSTGRMGHSPHFARLPKIKGWIDENNPGDPLIPFSVALEERLVNLSEEEAQEEQKSIGAQSALPKITQAGYASLDVSLPTQPSVAVRVTDHSRQLIRYFTCGPDEVRAWTIRKGTKAPQAAGVIQYVFGQFLFKSAIHTHLAPISRTSSSAVKS